MKKFLAAAILAAFSLSGGCSFKKAEKVSEVNTAAEEFTEITTSAESVSEAVTAAANVEKLPDDKLVPTAGKSVYDLAHLLNEEQITGCSEYINSIYGKYMLNAAVVTVSQLNGKAPSDFAAEAYNTIFGGESNGILFLVNNDTNEDILYKSGNCSLLIPAETESEALYSATNEIVNGQYDSAIQRMLATAESCPQYLFDMSGTLPAEQITAVNTVLSSSAKPSAIVLVNKFGEGKDINSTAEELFRRRFTDGNGIMILLDVTGKTAAAYSPEALPETLSAAMTEANADMAQGKFFEAANALAAALPTTQ